MAKAYITGAAARFPKSANLQEFWENLINGVDMLGQSRWPPGLYGLPPRNGCIPDLDAFDADFFGLSETEAQSSNMLLRLLLEVTYESIVDSGFTLTTLSSDKTGLYLACTFSDADVISTSSVTDSAQDSLRSSLVQRLSEWYGFQGPVLTVDTACSSSLAAMQAAVTDLVTGRCNYAVVAGINLIISPNCSQCFNQLSMLSPTGDSHVFDVSANGYVRSDGVGVLILSRNAEPCLRIYASIDDIAVNCDGYKEESVVFPSRTSQCSLLKSLYGENLIPTSCLSYVEAHGTGTQAGDRLEMNALLDALCGGRDEPLHVGSVKSNMGHCEAASGLAGLMKVMLSVHHGVVPPNLHYKTPNPDIKGIPLGKLKVVDKPLTLKGRMNVIGLNSFGFGGVNGHIVLMSYRNPRDDIEVAGSYLVPLTTRSVEGVDRALSFLEKHSDNVGMMSLLTRSMLSRDRSQGIRGYATIKVPKKVLSEDGRSLATYRVTVTTGQKLGAGTDANVFLHLHGDQGQSGKLDLKTSTVKGDQFEKGRTDEFILEAKDVGNLKRVTIGHDNKGTASGWLLDHLTVHSSTLQRTWRVPCGMWLAKDEGDGQIVRELVALDSVAEHQNSNVTMRWSPLSPSPPPFHLLLHDVTRCGCSPSPDLLNIEAFRKSVAESGQLLRDSGSDICMEDVIQSGRDNTSTSNHRLVCSVVCVLGLVDVLKAARLEVSGLLGAGVSEILAAHLDGCLTRSQCLRVVLVVGELLEQLSKGDSSDYKTYEIGLHPELSYKLGPKSRVLSYASEAKLIASIPTQHKDRILKLLQQTGGVYSELENVPLYDKMPDKQVKWLQSKLKNIIPMPKIRSDSLYTSSPAASDVDEEGRFGAETITHLLQSTVNQYQAVSSLPQGSAVVSVCLSSSCSEHEVKSSVCGLPEVHCHPKVESINQTIGELHMAGQEMDASCLYNYPLPVDCACPPLSPLVAWNHTTKYPLPDWCQFSARVKDTPEDVYQISLADLDVSIYDPVALLLYHVWTAISKESLQPTVLQGFTANQELLSSEWLHGASVFVQRGKKSFSVLAGAAVVMSGSYEQPGDELEIPLVPGYDVDLNDNVAKTQDDGDAEVETQEILWEDSWLDFINSTLEFVNSATQSLPIKMLVHPQKHLNISHDCASILVMLEETTGLCKAGSLVLQFPPSSSALVDQSILFTPGELGGTCLVEHLLLYTLPRYTGWDDKLMLYKGSEENKETDTIGFVSTNGDGMKHKTYTVPANWKSTDLEAVVPFLISKGFLEGVAKVKTGESVLVLPPLDTVSVYLLALSVSKDCQVFTSTWDPEIGLMLENAFPKINVLHPKALRAKLKQLTEGRGVDVCFKSDGSDMGWTLDLVAEHSRCVQIGRPSPKDTLGMSAFLRNLSVTTVDAGSVLRQQLDLADEDITATLAQISTPLLRERSEDGYPEPRGLGYSLEEQMNFSQPLNLQNLFAMLDGPGFKAKDIFDGLPDEDVNVLERLQEKLTRKPIEYSLAQNDLSCMYDSKEQFNLGRMSFNLDVSKDVLRACTPINHCSGLLAPPNSRCSRVSVDLSEYSSAVTPIIRITMDGCSPHPRDQLASIELKSSGLKLDVNYGDDKVFSTPTTGHSGGLFLPMITTDLVFLGTPKTSLTPHSPAVKQLLTPTDQHPVLVKLNTCDSVEEPLYILHPITGKVDILKALGEALKVPCYGIQRTSCTPNSSISSMAGFYRHAIELRSPTGPYRLAGYSLGGMIAFEIAKQMQSLGKKVECLIMLDGGPGFVHAQIDGGRDLLTRTTDVTHEEMVETVSLMSFMEMYDPGLKQKMCVRGVLEKLPNRYARIRMAVDFLMGNVVVSQSPRKTKWLSLKERVLNKEPKMNMQSVASEVIRLSREKKAEEYINFTLIADKYRPRDKITGDIHLLRIKSDMPLPIPVAADYGLGSLCNKVNITFLEGDHLSFLKPGNVNTVAGHITNILSGSTK